LVFRGCGQPFGAHAVFSLHFYAFMLLLFSVATAIPAAGVPFGWPRSTSQPLDTVLSITLLVLCGGYLYRAIGTVYGGRQSWRLTSAAILTFSTAVIVLAYRFALLLITLYTTA